MSVGCDFFVYNKIIEGWTIRLPKMAMKIE